MPKKNSMHVSFFSDSVNEAFARITVAAFVSQLDPTVDALYDLKTAVSEAVTNSIIHGYEGDPSKTIDIECEYEDRTVTVHIKDHGKGINNIEEAMTPLFTSSAEDERAGLGFTVMQSMMDTVSVTSQVGYGTTVMMQKTFD